MTAATYAPANTGYVSGITDATTTYRVAEGTQATPGGVGVRPSRNQPRSFGVLDSQAFANGWNQGVAQRTGIALSEVTREVDLTGEREFESLKRQVSDLRTQIADEQGRESAFVGRVAGDEIALFILAKIVQSGEVTTETLDANLESPDGWIAFARLTQARLVEIYGRFVAPTERGRAVVSALMHAGFPVLAGLEES